MMRLVVDADACPKGVLAACQDAGCRYGIPVWTVASYNHQIQSDQHIIVDGEAQAADMKIVNLARAGDVVITQDWGLAAMLLGRGAVVLGPSGREYRSETIDFLLEERETKAKLRRSGGRTKGPAKRTAADDQRFAAALERIIVRLREGKCYNKDSDAESILDARSGV